MAGSGTALDPFQVVCPTHFKSIGDSSNLWTSHFILKNNLDLSGVPLSPIGNSTVMFAGTFDGGGYKLSNVSMSTSTLTHFGIFGRVQAARITNLVIENIQITSTVVSGYVGGLVGTGEDQVEINSITLSGSVQGQNRAGGIVGYHTDNNPSGTGTSLTLSNLDNYATVSATNSAGGIIGETDSCGLSTGLRNFGNINANTAGGIAGNLYGEVCLSAPLLQIRGCSNAGTITGTMNGGGVAGDTNASPSVAFPLISRCKNTGTVSGFQVGGIAGIARGAFADSWTSGTIGSTYAGISIGGAFGIFSFGSAAEARRVYSTGDVNATDGSGFSNCGSYIGQTGFTGLVLDSFASGSVTACSSSTNRVGRFTGNSGGGFTYTNVYFNSAATCNNSSGACGTVVGTPIDLGVTPAYFNNVLNLPISNWDFATIWQIGPGNFPLLQ